MATLSTSGSDRLSLTLRGANEDRILATLRRWPHWNSITVERDPNNSKLCLSVTLTTQRHHESTLREILRRSFGLNFSVEGGDSELAAAPPVPERKRRR